MYMLASDYDGTLNRGGICERDREAIAAFRAAGNLFGIVTGRDARFYETTEREDLKIDFIIALNGAMTVSATGENAGEITYAEEVPNDGVIRGITSVAARYGSWLSYCYRSDRAYFHEGFPDGNDKYAPLSAIAGIERFNSLNACCETPELARACAAEINRLYGYAVNALQNYDCIDIPPHGIDKGEGVRRYAAEAGIPEDRIYTAGDNMNDMAMIRRFHGCAVSNACPEIREAAEGVYGGIADIIGYLLNKRD